MKSQHFFSFKKYLILSLYYFIICSLGVFGFYHDNLAEMGTSEVTFFDDTFSLNLNELGTSLLGGAIIWWMIVPKMIFSPSFLLRLIFGFILHLHAIVGITILLTGVERNRAYKIVEIIILGGVGLLFNQLTLAELWQQIEAAQ